MGTSYSTKQVAKIMECTTGNVARMIRAGELIATKGKHGYDINCTSVEKWVYMARTSQVQDFINERLGEIQHV